MNRILGIDYGERRVGLALSDPLNIFAKPILIIDRKSTPDFIKEISLVVEENSVNQNFHYFLAVPFLLLLVELQVTP